MPGVLYKAPAESRKYSWDFSQNLSTTAAPRSTTWGTAIFGTGEGFEAAMTLPLLFSLVPTTSSITITATRDDGQASDLTVGTGTIAGNVVSAVLSGGTNGRTYTITAVATTNLGNVLAAQGQLVVTNTLPS